MDNNQHLDDLFRSAREQQAVHTYGDTKNRFLDSVQTTPSTGSNGKNGSFFSLKNWMIMLTTISAIVLTTVLLVSPNDTKMEKQIFASQSNSIIESKGKVHENKSMETPSEDKIQHQKTVTAKTESDPLMPENLSDNFIPPVQIADPLFKSFNPDLPNDDPYVIPTLTEVEIKENNKQKKAMLKALEKFDKKVWAYIPTGSFDYQGKTTSVQSFYMEKTEVSNLEYRTFLFDLLIQGRKDEFLKARPDYKQWSTLMKQENCPYEQHYFSHPAYNDYPVVNVSREGAEMYCKWLTQELIKVVDEKKKNNYNDVRIPQKVEWVKAASVEGKQLPYPWDGENIRNSDGAIMANCVRGYTTDTLIINANSQENDVVAPVKSYWPNEYDIYNLAGNVSEMVYEESNRENPGTAGGSWKTFYEGVKILAPDENKGVITPMPTIGFRVVMTYLKE